MTKQKVTTPTFAEINSLILSKLPPKYKNKQNGTDYEQIEYQNSEIYFSIPSFSQKPNRELILNPLPLPT